MSSNCLLLNVENLREEQKVVQRTEVPLLLCSEEEVRKQLEKMGRAPDLLPVEVVKILGSYNIWLPHRYREFCDARWNSKQLEKK